MGFKAGLDALEKGWLSWYFWESNHGLSEVQLVVKSLSRATCSAACLCVNVVNEVRLLLLVSLHSDQRSFIGYDFNVFLLCV